MPYRTQHGKVVDAAREISIPHNAHAALERSDRIDRTIPKDHTADHQPYSEPSAAPHPALKQLKQLTHVHEVFKKPR